MARVTLWLKMMINYSILGRKSTAFKFIHSAYAYGSAPLPQSVEVSEPEAACCTLLYSRLKIFDTAIFCENFYMNIGHL